MATVCKHLIAVLVLLGVCVGGARYTPDWDSLDTRPLPLWYDGTKVGVFIHWGVFSVPAFRSEWFWWDWQGAKYNDCIEFMKANYPPGFTYPDFGPKFTASRFDANKWAEVLDKSGAGYVVLTSKHHEGYTMWPSAHSWNWNAMDVGPHRDLVGELANAVRNKTAMFFGLYHSLFEWFNPLYLGDKANKFHTQNFVREKTLPELYEIVNRYKPDIIWSDGDWEAPDSYWNSTQFLAWLYNDSPVKDTVLTNDRWGSGDMCKHGGYFTCSDRYNPGVLQKHKWENAMTLDQKSWGYRRDTDLSDVLTIQELIATLAETVSCGGNLLVNIGPTSDGTIPPVFEERLLQMGQWLGVNADAIYDSKPWHYQNDTHTPGVWYTAKKISMVTIVYAFTQKLPESGYLYLGAPIPGDPSFCQVTLQGTVYTFPWTTGPQGGMNITVSNVTNATPYSWGWVFSLYGLKNQ
ncbi:alpha-L-fucosidase-like [Mizuhopecten yessoensis]|uniref:alpha-L-fucosidase n=1 Tax=Mizuhopecten yessoensis TaxID=6573 RepID=A0A210Q777_MIZYE|nr:alpha-L-fucosidase-like [Mizuhopecten yessoensis]OWF44584.1 Alpha-L-fucosidase [Mizuhopecten yessoensis]